MYYILKRFRSELLRQKEGSLNFSTFRMFEVTENLSQFFIAQVLANTQTDLMRKSLYASNHNGKGKPNLPCSDEFAGNQILQI